MKRFSNYAVCGSVGLAVGRLLIAAQPTSAQADQLLAAGLDSYQAQRYAEAESDLAQAAESFQAAGIRNLRLARTFYYLGVTRMALGHYEDAADPLERSAGMEDSNPSADPRDAAAAWQCLGTTSYRLRRYSRAEQAYRKVLELRPGAADVLSDLGAVYVDEGQPAKAEVTLQEALASAEKDPGVDPVVTASVLGNLGALYRSSGRRTQAEQALRRGLTILERNPDLTGVVRVHLLCSLASVLFDRGDYAEAAGLVREAAETIRKSPMIPPKDAAAVFENYAACLRKTHQKREAAQQEAQARRIRSGLPPEASVDVSQLRRR